MKDLVVLVADRNMEAAMMELLQRHEAMGIRQVQADIFVHPQHDPGVLKGADAFLRPFARQYSYALVLFDHEGCGREGEEPALLKEELKRRIQAGGWENRCEVIVLMPELEAWVWASSPVVPNVLGTDDNSLREVLGKFGTNRLGKPNRPKEAMEEVLRRSRIPRSSSLYAELARRVGVNSCRDPVFIGLRETLRRWFGGVDYEGWERSGRLYEVPEAYPKD